MTRSLSLAPALLALTVLAACGGADSTPTSTPATPSTILNVSYDPTRELYPEFNAAVAADWKAKTGQDLTVRHSHGGAGAHNCLEASVSA